MPCFFSICVITILESAMAGTHLGDTNAPLSINFKPVLDNILINAILSLVSIGIFSF